MLTTTFLTSEIFKNTYFKKLPEDLIIYIVTYNFDWAAKIIQHQSKICFKQKIKTLTSLMVSSLITFRPMIKITKISIFYKNKVLIASDIIKILALCKCCTRHQIDKPKTLIKWNETIFHGTQYCDCLCSCRHISRFICRDCE